MIRKFLTEKNLTLTIEVLAVSIILFFGLIVFANNAFDFDFYLDGDIHRGFHRGLDVWAGVNSYEAFNPQNMLTQEKVPGFFPLYFYLMAFFTWISDFKFVQFIDTLRTIIFVLYSAIGLLIYFYLRKQSILLGIFGMSIFMFNRWTLSDVISLKQESYVLLLLISSLLLLKKNKYLAFFLFGVATGIKHLTILISPILFFEFYKDSIELKYKSFKLNRIEFKKYLIAFILFLAPIVLPSISYLLDNPTNFINAILFNVTRESESMVTDNVSKGLDRVLVLYNQDLMNNFLLFLPRFPLVISLIIVTLFYFREKINMWSYATLAYLCFICFNPTLFNQYLVWFFVFLPFVFKEIFSNIEKNKN
jgi:hypothetical protein